MVYRLGLGGEVAEGMGRECPGLRITVPTWRDGTGHLDSDPYNSPFPRPGRWELFLGG